MLGDFYDVFNSARGEWHVVVGDVCGHGVDAARTTALARWTLRVEANHTSDPATLLESLNTVLFHHHDGKQFLTAQVLTVERERDCLRVQIATGGHPAPIHRRRDGTVEPIEVRGSLIGLFENVVIGCESVTFIVVVRLYWPAQARLGARTDVRDAAQADVTDGRRGVPR